MVVGGRRILDLLRFDRRSPPALQVDATGTPVGHPPNVNLPAAAPHPAAPRESRVSRTA